MEPSIPTLLDDVIYEVLSHCPLQTIGKCRLLSKQYNNLTYESSFKNLHNQRSKTASGFFIQSLRRNKYSLAFISTNDTNLSLDFLPEPVKIEASSNQGLLICVGARNYNHGIPRYYVCKPCTREWSRIPNPKTRFHTQSSGIMVLSYFPNLRYKIVRFSTPKYDNRFHEGQRMRCEVFDSSDWRWKKLEDVYLIIQNEFLWDQPASVCGSLHWLTTENHIFSFDMETESYSVYSLPEELVNKNVDGSCYFEKLVNYEGKLALICSGRVGQDNTPELWVLENYFKNVWGKRETISIEDCRRLEPYSWLVGFYGSDVALLKGFCGMMFYKFKNGSNIAIVKVNDHLLVDTKWIFPFQSDHIKNNLGVDPGLRRTRRLKKTMSPDHELLTVESNVRQEYFCFSPSLVVLVLLLAFFCFCYKLDL